MFRLIGALLLALVLSACASGSVVVTGTKRPPIAASEVQFYSKPPAEYEGIGIVKASSEWGFTQQGSTDQAVQELKKQAAAIGANGVLVTSIGGRDEYAVVVGEAIYVPKR